MSLGHVEPTLTLLWLSATAVLYHKHQAILHPHPNQAISLNVHYQGTVMGTGLSRYRQPA